MQRFDEDGNLINNMMPKGGSSLNETYDSGDSKAMAIKNNTDFMDGLSSMSS